MKTPDLRLYLGKGGSGKTYLALHQLKRARRVLIIDPTGQEELAAGAFVVRSPAALARLLQLPGKMRICWRGPDNVMSAEWWDWANQCAWAAGDLTLLWDEVDLFMDARRPDGMAYQIVHGGRHKELRILATSRRPPSVSKDIRALATRICVFRTQEPDDIKYLEHRMGKRATQELAGLARYQCLDWNEDGEIKIKKSPFF
jgi:hypothetical protein